MRVCCTSNVSCNFSESSLERFVHSWQKLTRAELLTHNARAPFPCASSLLPQLMLPVTYKRALPLLSASVVFGCKEYLLPLESARMLLM